jgi:hypothetical protein
MGPLALTSAPPVAPPDFVSFVAIVLHSHKREKSATANVDRQSSRLRQSISYPNGAGAIVRHME